MIVGVEVEISLRMGITRSGPRVSHSSLSNCGNVLLAAIWLVQMPGTTRPSKNTNAGDRNYAILSPEVAGLRISNHIINFTLSYRCLKLLFFYRLSGLHACTVFRLHFSMIVKYVFESRSHWNSLTGIAQSIGLILFTANNCTAF